MKLVQIFSILFLFYCTCTSAHRISVIKCREYSNIPTIRSVSQPHLVWLRIATENIIVIGVVGTLISENYVLTSVVSDLIVERSQVYFSPDEYYNIVERFTHPFFGGTAHHDIALLKLERSIELDAFHRPACLWTKKYFAPTTAELVTWNTAEWTNKYDTKELNILIDADCAGLHSQQNESLICMKPIAIADNKYVATPGSPIQIYKPDTSLAENYYVYGIFSFFYHNADPYINVGTKIYMHLDWIESYVWRQDTSGACGKVNENFQSNNSAITLYGEFPWHAAIYQLKGHGGRHYKCDGVVLNELTILTAANCVSNRSLLRLPHLLIAIMGVHDLEIMTDSSQERRVSRIIKQHKVDNNFAILKLGSLINFSKYVQPICLSSNRMLFDDRIGVLPGWGQMDFDMSITDLSKGYLSIHNETETSFSALYRNETGACSGSLGGGYVVKIRGRWYLKGVLTNLTSSGEMHCDSSNVVLFADALRTYGWIQENL